MLIVKFTQFRIVEKFMVTLYIVEMSSDLMLLQKTLQQFEAILASSPEDPISLEVSYRI